MCRKTESTRVNETTYAFPLFKWVICILVLSKTAAFAIKSVEGIFNSPSGVLIDTLFTPSGVKISVTFVNQSEFLIQEKTSGSTLRILPIWSRYVFMFTSISC